VVVLELDMIRWVMVVQEVAVVLQQHHQDHSQGFKTLEVVVLVKELTQEIVVQQLVMVIMAEVALS
tara:strand:+ start:307 stop:504 length:198 start_codon:yes stop_codon:yes gene_type:complete